MFLPRLAYQGDVIRAQGFSNVYVPQKALNGPDLLHVADLVISGGGTMNREAAVLGTPAYTLFKGEMGAVDKYLMRMGLLTQVISEEDMPKILIQKRNGHNIMLSDRGLESLVTKIILDTLQS